VSATTADEKPHHPQSYYRENEKKFHIVSAAAEGDDDLAKTTPSRIAAAMANQRYRRARIVASGISCGRSNRAR